jgi:hypothetical protein
MSRESAGGRRVLVRRSEAVKGLWVSLPGPHITVGARSAPANGGAASDLVGSSAQGMSNVPRKLKDS